MLNDWMTQMKKTGMGPEILQSRLFLIMNQTSSQLNCFNREDCSTCFCSPAITISRKQWLTAFFPFPSFLHEFLPILTFETNIIYNFYLFCLFPPGLNV